MPITLPGIRESAPDEPVFEAADVEMPEEQGDTSIDPVTGVQITVDADGGVTIDTRPDKPKKPKTDKFTSNLADELEDMDLGLISSEVLQGIESDIQSRQSWEDAYTKGISLMGLKMEAASADVGSTGSISKVYHPLLIETTVRYQSTAAGELLPASGPVKVRIDDPMISEADEQLANAFEMDFNHYLTVVAKEYYPDTDQLLFNQGWSGQAYKKIFECPIRKRPCSDLVLAPDLIVSNDVVDLDTATRFTHRIPMTNGVMRRMMRADVYRDVELGQPVEAPDDVERKVAEIAGIDIYTKLPADHRHTIYECYVELDLPGYEEDIPLPYIVTIDKDSKEVLAIYRNWEEGDEEYKTKCPFVKYGMIPAFGFYDLGFIHLLGNTTRALTAIERQLLDAGQFANFPGFLFAKQGGRQFTNEIRISPGSGKEIDTGGLPIQQVAMPLPYQGPSQVLAALAESIAKDGMRLGGASEITAGEGRADVPVGTTMALIEQATKVMSAVHKRNHVSQQREFEKLRDLFRKNPQALWKFAKNPARKWQVAAEFEALNLVPASDPNIPSHTHRIMQANALVMLAAQAPQVFNARNVAQRVLNTIGIKDSQNLLNPPPDPNAPPPPPPPEIAVKIMAEQNKAKQMQLSAQQQATHDQARIQETQFDAVQREKDRQSRENLELLKIKENREKQAASLQIEKMKHVSELVSDHLKHDSGLIAEHIKHHSGIQADHHKQKMILSSQEKQAAISKNNTVDGK